MTDEQCARLKAQLEKLREVSKRMENLPEETHTLVFPDLQAEFDALSLTEATYGEPDASNEAEVESFIERAMYKFDLYERYIARCNEYMEQKNENQTV